MLAKPKISVIILIYNVEEYIEKCAESLFSQSLDSIEYIFVNDCSNDNSIVRLKSVIQRYPERKDSIVIIENEQNSGQAMSRIKGIAAAHGEYVIACDSDDYIPPNAYETLYNHMTTTRSDIVACDFYRIYEEKQTVETSDWIDTPREWIRSVLISKKMGALWCHLIKRSLLNDIVKPEGNIMEDVVILIQALLKSDNVSTIHNPLYYYVQRPNSITNNRDKTSCQISEMTVNMDILTKIITKTNMSFKDELDCKRFFIKRWSLPLVDSPRNCSYWIGIQSEINKRIFFNPYISFKDKLVSTLIFMRLYPLIKEFKNENRYYM